MGDRPILVVNYDDTVTLPTSTPVLIGPADDATDVTTSTVLDVYVSDPDAEDMTVTFWGREHSASDAESFSIVVLPDTYFLNTVHTLLADYQARTNGGNGWLRILEFVPPENKINVKTYSPWLDA